MTKAISYEDRSESCKRGYCSVIRSIGSLGSESKEVAVYTPHGIVYVDAWMQRRPCTAMFFCFNGRRYRRYYAFYFSNRALVTKAKRFVKEIVNAE